jgi:hypothetical protein
MDRKNINRGFKKKAVMAEYRIVYYDGKIVGLSCKDYIHGSKIKTPFYFFRSIRQAFPRDI